MVAVEACGVGEAEGLAEGEGEEERGGAPLGEGLGGGEPGGVDADGVGDGDSADATSGGHRVRTDTSRTTWRRTAVRAYGVNARTPVMRTTLATRFSSVSVPPHGQRRAETP
jgi:hypothetical protein